MLNVGDHIVDGEVEPARLEPAAQGLHVVAAPRRRDGAKQRVLEQEIEWLMRLVAQKIADAVVDCEPLLVGQALGQGNGAWGEIKPGN